MEKDLAKSLTETRNQLVNEIIILGQEAFNYQPDPQTWSIAQVCHHLFLVERASTKAIEIGLHNRDQTGVEYQNLQFILDRTKKRKAPSIVEPDEGPLEVQLVLKWLHDARDRLTALLNTIENKAILEGQSFQHPVYGNLSLFQWVELLYLHEQRHIEQIKEIKRSIGIRN